METQTDHVARSLLRRSWNSNLKFFVLSFSVCSVFAKGPVSLCP